MYYGGDLVISIYKYIYICIYKEVGWARSNSLFYLIPEDILICSEVDPIQMNCVYAQTIGTVVYTCCCNPLVPF